jgi:putative SOS response-associated peptidase YedK
MCNTYNLRGKPRDVAMIFDADLADPHLDFAYESIHPDYSAPVIRPKPESKAELVMMRWGFPPSDQKDRRPVVNARNLYSDYWRPYHSIEQRCLVPATSYAEWTPEPNPETGKKQTVWFGLNDNRSPFAFAGLWRSWQGVRGTKSKPVEGQHLLYALLTTRPNAVVKPIHAQSMPVILRTPEEWQAWLTLPIREALKLQQPLPDDAIKIVATGSRGD